jgi:CubicO group peptidase (beta-lactamase class C family)
MAALALASGVCAGSSPDAIVEGDAGRRLDQVASAWAGGRFWGAVLVEREGRVLLAKGYGMADFASEPNTADTLFDVASVSKQFTAAAVLKLEEEGLLSVDDPVSKFFPGAPPDKGGVTLLHLLRHESGLPFGDVGFALFGMSEREAAALKLLAPPLQFKPGDCFSYSNTNYFLLAAVVEKASGRPFEAFVREALFRPAGLDGAGFVGDPDAGGPRAALRDSPEGRRPAREYAWDWGNRGATGILISVKGLLTWWKALRSGRILGEAALEKFLAPGFHGYALGWFADDNLWGVPRLAHSGETQGFQSRLSVLRRGETVIAAATGDRGEVGGLVERLEAVLCGPAASELERARPLAGAWRLPGGNLFDVALENGILSVRSSGTEASSRLLFGWDRVPRAPAYFDDMAKSASVVFADPEGKAGGGSVFDASVRPRVVSFFWRQWSDCRRAFGEYLRPEIVASFSGPEQVTFVRAVFEKGDAVFRGRWHRSSGRFTQIERVPNEYPVQVVLRPLSTVEFVGRPMFLPGRLRVLVPHAAGDPPGEFVWEDESEGEVDRIVCTRLPPGRS